MQTSDTTVDFGKHYGRILAFFRGRGFLIEEALDLTQETFLRASRQIHKLRSAHALARWLLQIAKNVWKNEIRYRRASKRLGTNVSLEELSQDIDIGELIPLVAGGASSPLDGLITAERLDLAQRCMEALPHEVQRCLRLYAYKQFTYAEIAIILQISIDTVKKNIHDGRSELKKRQEQVLAGDS